MPNLPALTPTTFAEAMEFARVMSQSTMVPKDYQRNPANILLAVQWGAELGMPPLQALNGIAVINNRPSLWGDAMLALCKGSPLCEDIIEAVKGRLEDETATAVCEARRKGKEPVIRAFSVADARKAGLWGKNVWAQYPLRMLAMRARGFALRDAFPDLLRGIISAEEAADIPRTMKDVTPVANVAAELDAFAAVGEAHDVEPDQAEVDEVLAEARAKALEGTAAFRMWYVEAIDDAQRELVKPHLRALQDTAKAVVIDDKPARKVPRKRKADEPTEEQIAKQQSMLAEVLGPDEIDKLTAADPDPAPIEEPPDYSVVVSFDPEANAQEWFVRARNKLRQMDELEAPGHRYTAFRKANLAGSLRLKLEFGSYAQELEQMITAGERR